MKAVGLLAQKGGAGKTTCAIHMGVLAQMGGMKTLFFDLDPQGSLATWWRSRSADTPGLVETDARRLPELLRAAAADGYDLAVIDTPPAVTFDTARVAQAVDLAMIPLRPSILDILAVARTADVVKAARVPALLVLNACAPPREKGEAVTTTDAREALVSIEVTVAHASLAQRIDYTRALNEGEAVNEFAPDSKAASEIRLLWREVQERLR